MTQSISILEKIWKPNYQIGAILWKYAEQYFARHNIIRNAPINYIFDVAIALPGRNVPIDLKQFILKELRIDLKWRFWDFVIFTQGPQILNYMYI